MLQHGVKAVPNARRFVEQFGQHQTRARLHRGGDSLVPESAGSVSGIRRSPFQLGVRFAAARQADRGADALQGGHSHPADVRGRLQQHGQHAEGDARYSGRSAVLLESHNYKSGIRRRA